MSVINTYFMSNEDKFQIRNSIKEYLNDKPKRVIDEKKKISEDELLIGKYVASQIILEIWESFINKIKNNKWPS